MFMRELTVFVNKLVSQNNLMLFFLTQESPVFLLVWKQFDGFLWGPHMTVAGSVQEEIAGVLIEVCFLSAAEMKIFGSFLGVLLKIFARKTEMEKK